MKYLVTELALTTSEWDATNAERFLQKIQQTLDAFKLNLTDYFSNAFASVQASRLRSSLFAK
jgi:hypothetical protein